MKHTVSVQVIYRNYAVKFITSYKKIIERRFKRFGYKATVTDIRICARQSTVIFNVVAVAESNMLVNSKEHALLTADSWISGPFSEIASTGLIPILCKQDVTY